MLSESARVTTASESLFRVQAPNSMPRRILVVALDSTSANLGDHLAEQRWSNIRFANFEIARPEQNPAFARLGAIDENTCDVVVIVGTAGRDLGEAKRVAQRCEEANIQVSAVLIASKRAKAVEVREALLGLRPLSRTLAVIRDGELLRSILEALGH